MEPPPRRPALVTEWCGEQVGRVMTKVWLAGRRPLMEWILVTSSASSKKRSIRMEMTRFVSVVLPDPSGPMSSLVILH
jgi:hypothetical protein